MQEEMIPKKTAAFEVKKNLQMNVIRNVGAMAMFLLIAAPLNSKLKTIVTAVSFGVYGVFITLDIRKSKYLNAKYNLPLTPFEKAIKKRVSEN